MSISVQNSSIKASNLTLEECKNKVKKISIIGGSGSRKSTLSDILSKELYIPGCKERLDFTFVKYVWSYNKTKRPNVLEMIKSVASDKVLIFKKQKDLNKWLKDFTHNDKILDSIK